MAVEAIAGLSSSVSSTLPGLLDSQTSNCIVESDIVPGIIRRDHNQDGEWRSTER